MNPKKRKTSTKKVINVYKKKTEGSPTNKKKDNETRITSNKKKKKEGSTPPSRKKIEGKQGQIYNAWERGTDTIIGNKEKRMVKGKQMKLTKPKARIKKQ